MAITINSTNAAAKKNQGGDMKMGHRP